MSALRPCPAGRGRRPGRHGSSPGPLIDRRRARSKRGGARDRTRAERARTQGRYRSAVDQASVRARAAQAARSVLRWPSRHRLTAEAAALIQPSLGVQIVAPSITASGEIDRTELTAAAVESRGGGPLPDAPGGLLSAVIGREAPRLRQICAAAIDDPEVVGAAVVLEDQELQRVRDADASCAARELTRGAGLLCCGGHGQPPLCPSDRRRRPESEKGLGLAERTNDATTFRPPDSDFAGFSHHRIRPPRPPTAQHPRRRAAPCSRATPADYRTHDASTLGAMLLVRVLSSPGARHP